ncbi:peptidase domain-containing ABC transporter [Desulfovibrio inopinatus]|uniref:peptidase domain-containing ABC transporter n=1 Tax=Desulfovibrio inopinatus TaxID=102109 RepID=UPI0004094670|nr:ATP-binding cassette domain-containing protein [Desulfovibrio inopinatus]
MMVTPSQTLGFVFPGGLGPCIPPLLDALGWRGSDAHLAESFPHLSDSIDLSDLLNVMANLKFGSRSVHIRQDALDPRMLPCLFVDENGRVAVLAKSDGRSQLVFDADTQSYSTLSPQPIKGTAFFFTPVDIQGHSLHRKQQQWFRKALSRFHKTIKQGLLISFLLSVLALIMPLFVMMIYDQMPFFENNTTLAYISMGVIVFVLSDFGLRVMRNGILSFIGARLGNIVGNEVFRRILYLPPSFTESASIGSQAARIRDFETIRDFFSGQAFIALLEIPFITLLVVAMGFLGGYVVFVPLLAIGSFLLLALIYLPKVRRSNAAVAKANAARQELVMEILLKMRAIKMTSTPGMWETRFRQLSAECSAQSYQAAQLASQINVWTNSLIMGAGVCTMAFSVKNVLAGTMSMGALVACMILVWRILAPLRSAFVVMLQVERINKSVNQVDRLMNLDIEHRSESLLNLNRNIRGQVAFSQVSIRYMKDAQPALLSVSFKIENNEILAVAGHDGAGKSTILKLIMGLYSPQAGRITLNNTSLGQIDPLSLRRSISYAPQDPHFFYGTIAQNLRLTNPLASDDALRDACKRSGILEAIEAMPEGMGTRIGDHRMKQIPVSFLKKLNLARALLRPASLVLLDEVLERPGADESSIILDALEELRGHASIVMVTNSAPYLKLVDKILWLEKGRVRAFGAKDAVLPLLPAEYRC